MEKEGILFCGYKIQVSMVEISSHIYIHRLDHQSAAARVGGIL